MKSWLSTVFMRCIAILVFALVTTVAAADSPAPPWPETCKEGQEGRVCHVFIGMKYVEGRCMPRFDKAPVPQQQQQQQAANPARPPAIIDCVPLSTLVDKPIETRLKSKGRSSGVPAETESDDCSVGSGPTSMTWVVVVWLLLLLRQKRLAGRGRAHRLS